MNKYLFLLLVVFQGQAMQNVPLEIIIEGESDDVSLDKLETHPNRDISAQELLRSMDAQSCDNQEIRELVKKQLIQLKNQEPEKYRKLLQETQQKKNSGSSSESDFTTQFLLQVLAKGLEQYKKENDQKDIMVHVHKATISRQAKVTGGSIVVALISAGATIFSTAIAAYFGAKSCT